MGLYCSVYVFSLPPQHAGVILKEPFQTFVTSRQGPVCVGQALPVLAVTPVVEDAVTPSLPASCVPLASSP